MKEIPPLHAPAVSRNALRSISGVESSSMSRQRYSRDSRRAYLRDRGWIAIASTLRRAGYRALKRSKREPRRARRSSIK